MDEPPELCPGCGLISPPESEPTHAYMTSSPACWRRFGEVLAREYSSPALFAACHRLTVDAYALQHPGSRDDRRARQSVSLHYESLRAIFEDGASHKDATALLQTLANNTVPPLPSPPTAFPITVAALHSASTEKDHARIAETWARASFDAWQARWDASGG